MENYLTEFRKSYTKFASVNRWKNTFRNESYEHTCLKFLAKFCQEFKTSPDELVQSRIEELKSSNQLVRATAEDRVLAYHKKLSKETPGLAINMFRKIKSFYRANYVALQCRDPGYQIQREFEYIPTREEIRKMCEIVPLDTRVYLLTLAESCGRPGAVANLRWKDIKHEIATSLVPCQVWLAHKVRLARRKYFSFICADAVQLWKTYLETFAKLTDNTSMFKRYHTLHDNIMDAAVQIGIAEKNKKLQPFKIHNLRKRGQTILEACHIPLNWVDRLLGHVPRGASGQTYSLPPVEKLRAEYVKAMMELQIYETPNSLIVDDVAQEVADDRIRRIVQQTFMELLQKASAEDAVQLQQLLKRKLV